MSAQLNHTIVWCQNKHISATFLVEILGLPPPRALRADADRETR